MAEKDRRILAAHAFGDGSIAYVTDHTPVPLAGRDDEYGYREITWHSPAVVDEMSREDHEVGNSNEPEVAIRFFNSDGSLEAVEVRVSATPVRGADLAAIRVDEIRDKVVRAFGVLVPEPDGPWPSPWDRKPPRRGGLERSRQVAEIHATATGDKAQAVADEFGVNKRTAFRYIARAKQEGLIK